MKKLDGWCVVLCDAGLTPAGGSTVFGRFPLAVSGYVGGEVSIVPGNQGEIARRCADRNHPLCKSLCCAKLSAGPIGLDELRMSSRFVRHQP